MFGVDATFFASRTTPAWSPIARGQPDRDLGVDLDPAEIAEVVSTHPAVARAMVNLHRRYRITTAQLTAGRRGDRFTDSSGSAVIAMPHEEVRDYFYDRQNYLDELDTAAEDPHGAGMHRGDLARDLSQRLNRRVHGAHRAAGRLGDSVLLHRYDPQTRTLGSGTISRRTAVFRLATGIGLHLEVRRSDRRDDGRRRHIHQPGVPNVGQTRPGELLRGRNGLALPAISRRRRGIRYDVERPSASTRSVTRPSVTGSRRCNDRRCAVCRLVRSRRSS